MKDLTHYFQSPKPAPNSCETKVAKTTPKCKRKASESVDPEGTKSSTSCNGDTVEEEVFKTKKLRRSNSSSKKKAPKSNCDDTSHTDNISDNENTPASKKTKNCNGDVTDSVPVKKVRTYKKRKPQPVVESKTDTCSSFDGMNLDVRVVLTDCVKDCSPVEKTNRVLEVEGSDSDSCFVSEKKPKKNFKMKNDKEEEPGKNNLLNYFSKVDKMQKKNSDNRPTTITVQAIVHSPPKDKSKLIKERDPNVPNESPVVSKKFKKKICNFDDIKVIEEVTKNDDTSLKNSSSVPTTPQPQIENVSPDNMSSKGKSWKMRVKLTPSSKLEDVITKNSKAKKYRKIIVPSNCSDEEDIEPKIESEPKTDENDVEFISETKPEKIETPQPIKLAPLFCKRETTKNTADKIRINDEAKRQFLESGVPEAIKKKMEENKNIVEEEYKGEYVFPKCSHVQQKDTESFVWNLTEYSDFKFKKLQDDVQIEERSRQWCSSLYTDDFKLEIYEDNVERVEFDIKSEISLLKKQEPGASVSEIHSSIKRLNKVSENVNDICWTQKYKPFVFGDMIGNTNSVNQLREWIESHKRMKQVFLESDSSSGGEFVDSDDSSCSTDVKNNIAILVGPPGCGKTCAVYMLANELGFKVIEVNAGSNRAGKKIIDELLEATQSHRVKRTVDSMFNSKPEKSKKKRKKSKETKKEKKTISLILIEDADILFENHDEGFLSALNSLTSLSKRPLIFTVNNLNYPHLHKYNNSQNLILRFDYPSRTSINAWLKVIALVEGVQLTDEMLIELFKIAGSDLRKNLLQLQMIIQSKCQYPKSNNEQLFYQNWLSHVRCLGDKRITPKLNSSNCENPHEKLFSDDEAAPLDDFKKPFNKDDVVNVKSKAELRKDREALLESVKFLNYAANLDNFTCDDDMKIFPPRVCLAKDENDFNYRMNCDLVEFIKNKIFEKYDERMSFSFKKYYNAVTQNSRIKSITENVFVSFYPRISNQQAKSCDYLPIIRNIARSEKNKTSSSLRRSNRYFGYLKSICIDISEKETEILCNTFVS